MSNALFVKPLPFAAVTASATAAGRDPAYVGNDHMGVVWESPTGATSRSIVVDMGADVVIDTAILLGCTGATSAWTLRVDAATSAQGITFPAGSWAGATLPFLAGAVLPVSGRGRAIWQAPASPPPASRYWRFTIGGLANAAAVVARIVMGQKIQLQHNVVYGAAFGVRDLGGVDFSRRGVLIRQQGVKLRTINVTYPATTRAEVETHIHPLLEQVGNSDPVAFVLDPDADNQRQNRIWYGTLIGDLGSVWARYDGFEWRANIVDFGA